MSSVYLFGNKVCPVPWYETTLESLAAIASGEEVASVGYDSDDEPEALVNKRIKVRRCKYQNNIYGVLFCSGACFAGGMVKRHMRRRNFEG